MASPGDKKGQQRGSCGHVVASFDLHDKCARCRDKLIGEDDCVKDKPCKVCDGFSDIQKEMFATPSYKIRKDKKAGLLVSPKEVTVLQPVDNEPTFQSPSGQSTQPSAHSSSIPPSGSQSASFVTADQLAAISDKWAEQFARMEALLSRGNVFSTSVSTVKPIDTQPLISQQPFLAPASRPTGPVEVPVAVDALVKTKAVDHKEKKKSHKSGKEKHSETAVKTDQNVVSSDHKSGKKSVSDTSEKKRDRSASPSPRPVTKKHEHTSAPPADTSSCPDAAHQSGVTKGDTHKPTSGHDKNTTGSLSGQPQWFLNRIKTQITLLPVPVPVPSHRLQKWTHMNKFLRMNVQ